MENINSTTQIVLAIVGSGIISTIIVISNDWIKDIFKTKQEKNREIFRIRETTHKEFLKNIDFLYKNDYLSGDEVLKKKHNFFKTYRMMFLYSEDDEIKKINGMMDAITTEHSNDDSLMKARKDEVAKSFLSLRRHVIKNTQLTEKDFRHLS